MSKYAIELVIAAACVGIVVVDVVGSYRNKTEFETACNAAHGTTVHDGRQYQCLKAKE